MKKQLLSIAILIFLLSYFLSVSSVAEAKDDNNFGWSYSIENGFEKTKRTYLLVYNPQSQQERQITVVSQCSKPYMTEGTYGKCNHKINIQPTNKIFSLDTGEDVVIVNSSFDSLILGTIEYGCCAASDTVRFYTEDGSYLGRLTTMSPSKSRNNVITDMFDFSNSTGRHESAKYLVVQDDKDDYKYYAWIKENRKEMIKIPIHLTIPDKENCDEWYLSDFTKYVDRQDITLTLEGRFCEKQNRTFSCQKIGGNVNCTLNK
jgi:hypothetical protein